jgi:hypothetical protein
MVKDRHDLTSKDRHDLETDHCRRRPDMWSLLLGSRMPSISIRSIFEELVAQHMGIDASVTASRQIKFGRPTGTFAGQNLFRVETLPCSKLCQINLQSWAALRRMLD